MPMDMTQLQFQGEHGRDEFQREAVAANVISLLTSPVDISPMVINGDWGAGKTEFCHKLINKFNAEHDTYQVVYVDAFQADHADDPLMTILAEVIKLLPEGEQRKGFIQKALPVARYGLKTILKAGAGHILRQDADDVADGLEEHLKDAANKAIDASVEAVLKDHEKAEESLKALQNALADIAADSSIVLFVDELDRCRPDFAVQMLEVIKHTFDVEGVQFVLVTNTTQLKAAINHCYGQGVDAQRYLDKFLKFSFELPVLVPQRGIGQVRASVAYYCLLIQQSELLAGAELLEGATYNLVEHVIIHQQLSLREVESLVRYLEIYQVLSEGNAIGGRVVWGYQLLRIFGVLLASIRPQLAKELSEGKLDAKAFGTFLGVAELPDFGDGFHRPSHVATLTVMLGQECSVNPELLTPTQDVDEQWEEHIRAYFARGGFPPEKGRRSEIVVKAIRTVGLGA